MPDDRPGHRRLFTVPNIIAVTVGVAFFFALGPLRESNAGAVTTASFSGAVAALVWWLWIRIVRSDRIDAELDSPRLAAIPTNGGEPTPTLTEPGSPTAMAYRLAAANLEAVTTGRVLLVSSPSPGQGASTVALNIAISATQAGRRVVLIDGDTSGAGLSRFGHMGSGPGLIDIANGTADLVSASRMWALSATATLPFIPSGAPSADGDGNGELRSGLLADAVDRITEHADLLLIDAPPVGWNGDSASLAAHADGAVLVVAEGCDPKMLADAAKRLADAGAPVVAHVVNRAGVDRIHPAALWRRMIKRGLVTAVISLVALGAWTGYQVWQSWRSVEREVLDVAAASAILPLPTGGIVGSVTEEIPDEVKSVVTAPPTPVIHEDIITSFLVVGSDEGGNRADVIILALLGHRDGPVMFSIPRDLYLPNRCTQSFTRINATFLGCGDDVNGPTLLALAVEDFTGIPVDHFALFTFEGFPKIIDEIGGVEICVENPVRDRKAHLDLPGGCTNASGEQALAWVRSRKTQELRNGVWQTMQGVSDLTRNTHQLDLILEMFGALKKLNTPADLAGILRSLASAFTLDDQLGVTDVISLAWDLRDLDPDSVTRIEIPVKNFTTPEGAKVLVPTVSFDELIATTVPELAPELV